MRRRKTAFAMVIVTSIILVFGSTSISAASAVLMKESQGSEVTALQNDLIRLGYLSEEATGYFGNATEAAVKKVQKEYGYEADGIAGEVTLSLVDRLRGRSSTSTVKSSTSVTAKATGVSTTASTKLLKEGDESSSVTALQKKLIKLGYLDTNATGYYGPATAAAVEKLQKKYGYIVDGIAGSATLALVEKLVSGSPVAAAAKTTATTAVKAASTAATTTAATTTVTSTATEVKAASTEATTAATTTAETAATTAPTTTIETPAKTADTASKVKTVAAKTQADYLLKWYGNVENKFAIGDTATVYDIKTGTSFKIKRTYGHNHADCETLTAKDTATMKKIYNGTWSWERRAIIVTVGDLKIAACMTGLPHAGVDKYAANKTVSSRSGGYGRGTNLDAVKGNSMNGVFDIHFLGSKNHYNNKIDPKHQALVKEAAKWAAENYK